ncbi:MAG: hypothetical protein ABIA74_03150 [bacterium]
MKFTNIFLTIIFLLNFSNDFTFAGKEENKKMSKEFLYVVNERLEACKTVRDLFELSQILRQEEPKYLLFVNWDGFAEFLFKLRGYKDDDKIKKIEVCAALGINQTLVKLLDSCEKVSMIICARFVSDGKNLIDYAQEFNLKDIEKILQDYEDALD